MIEYNGHEMIVPLTTTRKNEHLYRLIIRTASPRQ